MTGPPPPSWAVDPGAARAARCAEGVWRLRLPLSWPGIDHVNAYLLERDDGLLLVDCGSAGDPSCREALAAAIEQTGAGTLADVRALAITHAHSDHSGLAAFVSSTSGCEVWIHPDHAHFYGVFSDPAAISAARRRRARREGVPKRLLPACADVREELQGAEPLGLVRPLRAGVRFATSAGEWEVVETPGHAPSHVCLLAEDAGVAIVGDLLCRVFVPWFDYGFTPDPIAEYCASLDRLDQVEAPLALAGHGRPLEDLSIAIEEHRSGIAARLAAARQALRAPARGAYEVALRMFGEQRDAIASVDRLVEVFAYLRHLRLAGEVARESGAGDVFRYTLV
ncbi:MAG: MBL fold metallo-hydrolase [Solirubrobacteraceae bacterium]